MREQPRRASQALIPSRTPSPRVAIFVLVVTGFALLMVGRTDPAVFEGLRLRVMETLSPVLETATGPVRKVRGWRQTMAERSAAFEDNQRLKKEIAALRENTEQARQNAFLVERYQALLNIQLDPKIDYITARIIGDTGGPFMRTLVLNAGRSDGVAGGQGVIDSDGLIGRIVTVGEKSSRVLLLTDVKSRVPVLLRPSNIHAMLVGDNSPEPTLEYVADTATAGPGEQVLTSGRGGLLPPNMPIGSVKPSESDGDIIRVKLAADFNRLDFVRVMRFSAPIDLPESNTPDLSGPPQPATPTAELTKKPTPVPSAQAAASPVKAPPALAAAPPPPAPATTVTAAQAAGPVEEEEDRGEAGQDVAPIGAEPSAAPAPAPENVEPQGDIVTGGAVRAPNGGNF